MAIARGSLHQLTPPAYCAILSLNNRGLIEWVRILDVLIDVYGLRRVTLTCGSNLRFLSVDASILKSSLEIKVFVFLCFLVFAVFIYVHITSTLKFACYSFVSDLSFQNQGISCIQSFIELLSLNNHTFTFKICLLYRFQFSSFRPGFVVR